MKFLFPLLISIALLNSSNVQAQCGNIETETYISAQEDLQELILCEVFQGDLHILGAQITNLEALSSLLTIQGSLYIYDTEIVTIEPLSGLMNAQEINIYNNNLLAACCASLDWQDAVAFGSIEIINLIENAEGCNSYTQAQATCLGLIPGCTDANAVNYNPQATFEDGSCLNGPDLQVSTSTILNSLDINTFTSSDECLVAEGCITGTGERATLRFTTSISNYGNEDFFIGQTGGVENLNENFYWDDCHGHAHYEGYANYRLYYYPSLEPHETIGHKNGWCVMDLGGAIASEAPEGANYPTCNFEYGCTTMGISAGCSDTYGSGISCQWVDITDLTEGEYVLAVSTNMETDNYQPQYETDFSNNVVYVLFEFEGDEIIAASEFDGSAISDICNPAIDAIDLGFNFSDNVTINESEIQMPSAFLNEYFTESVQFVLTETINFNGEIVFIDSLEINDIVNLPVGLNWACEPQTCSFQVGNSCIGINGIPTVTGDFNASFTSTLHLSNSQGIHQEINLPYNGGNNWLDSVLAEDYSVFDAFTPDLNYTVEIPVYGCLDSLALNFNANVTFNDGTCIFPDLGCTDPFALNFDQEANTEDGSCEYCVEGAEWVAQIDLIDSYGDGWNGNYYYLINEWGDTTNIGTIESGSSATDLVCLSPGCYVMSVPVQGGWPNEISWEITSAGFPDIFVSGGCPDLQPFSFLTDCEIQWGCMDTLALNYDELAEFSNDSCAYPVFGCLDSLGLNYNELATNEDGSCVYPVLCDENSSFYILHLFDNQADGWSDNVFSINDTSSLNYFETTLEAGSAGITSFCLSDGCYEISVDGGTWQQDISWELENASGTIIMESTAPFLNYFGVNTACEIITGCSDSLATNFNELVNIEDGSCVYPVICNEEENIVLMELQTDPYPTETSWDLISETGDTLYVASNFTAQNTLYADSVCVPNDQEITLHVYDTYGDGLTSGAGDGQFNFYVCGVQVFSGSDFENLYSGFFTGCDGASIIVFGCTDASANNFSPDANTEDGSCEYDVVLGCTDSLAVNFDDSADTDDGSCEYVNCAFYEMMVEVNLLSTNGNGWNGHTYTLSSFDDTISIEETMLSGFNETNYHCLPNGCYLFTVPEYMGGETFNWSIIIENKKQISGTTGVKDHFGVNQVCEMIMGCTDQSALNFNPLATIADSTCVFQNGGTQSIDLNQGWNMASSYVEASNPDMALIVNPIMDQLAIVKDYAGMAFLPEWGYNGIGEWENEKGYQIKVTENAVLNISGNFVEPELTPITLLEGWSMIAYLREESASPINVFEDVFQDLVIVKNGEGLAYLPEWEFNGIGQMEKGKAYQVKMATQRVLIYNANSIEYKTETTEIVNNKTSRLAFEKNTGTNMHLVVPDLAFKASVTTADEVYVYDSSGGMVGAAKVTLPNTIITIWGNDELSTAKDGLYSGEEWTLELYSNLTHVQTKLECSIKNGKATFEQDALLIANEVNKKLDASSFILFNAVPNPSNQVTEIRYFVPEEKFISLRLYNLLGEEILQIDEGLKSNGYHASEVNVGVLAPGTYFYKLQSDKKQVTKRLEVVK